MRTFIMAITIFVIHNSHKYIGDDLQMFAALLLIAGIIMAIIQDVQQIAATKRKTG